MIKIGMVGCGAISYTHGAVLKENMGAKFTACCDIVEESAQKWAADFNC